MLQLIFSFPATCALASLFGIPLLQETYAPVIKMRRDKKWKSDPEQATGALNPVQMSKMQYLWLNLSRPIHLLFGSFICFILSLYMAL